MRRLDGPLLVAVLALCFLGIEVLNSVTAHHSDLGAEATRQLVCMGVGLVLMLILSRIEPWTLGRLWIPLYAVGLAGLCLVRIPGIGFISHGARRWIALGPLGAFQPSEPAKLILVVAIAALVASRSRAGAPSYATTLLALVLAALPSFLVFLQPDLGTALVLMGTVLIMLTVAGAPPALLLGLVGAVCLLAPHYMHDYQRARMLVYLHPEADPSGIGYNLIQARIATGAGGQWGSGLYLGSMTQTGFVPENHTDFIFSAMGEELGFVGCAGFLALCTILVSRVVRAALLARERFDMLLATGVAAMLSLHAIINVAMVIGVLPATGVPLPFVSYGGTAVMTQMAILGLVLAVVRKEGRIEASIDDRWDAEPIA